MPSTGWPKFVIGLTAHHIRYRANRQTFVQVQLDAVTYYHLELPRHDVLLAESLPVESYLDTGDRANFANGGNRIALHPDFGAHAREAESCAPLIVTGPELAPVRRRVSAWAMPPLPTRTAR
jgi:Hint domain-containing protein